MLEKVAIRDAERNKFSRRVFLLQTIAFRGFPFKLSIIKGSRGYEK